eukprot:jgi/Tetstr1/427814/TSEL_001786.t1
MRDYDERRVFEATIASAKAAATARVAVTLADVDAGAAAVGGVAAKWPSPLPSHYCGRYARLRTIVISLTESEFDPSELLVHPFSQTVREAGELGGNTGHNKLRRTAMGLRKKSRKTPPESLAFRAEQRPVYTLTLQLTAHHHNIIGKGKGATLGTHEKKHPRGRSRPCGTTHNRSRSKPRLSGIRDSDIEWEIDGETANQSGSSHQ